MQQYYNYIYHLAIHYQDRDISILNANVNCSDFGDNLRGDGLTLVDLKKYALKISNHYIIVNFVTNNIIQVLSLFSKNSDFFHCILP